MSPGHARPQVALVALTLLGAVLLGAAPAAAASIPGGLSSDELRAVAPLLKRFDVVALSETNADGTPRAMTLATRVKAPREVVFDIFKNPENFYYLSTLFKENKVLQEHDNSKAFSWASRHKLFSFTGTNTIALYPPRRADVEVVQSNIGRGRFKLIFHEDGPEHTIVVVSGILDVLSSEWLIRYLVGGNPAMREAMNMAIGLVMTKGIRALGERLAAGKGMDKHRTGGRRRGELIPLGKPALERLESLVDRGSVILSRSVKRGRMRQLTVLERFDAPAGRILKTVAMPELYPKMIRAISDVTVHERTPELTDFSWTFGLSAFSMTSRNRLTVMPDGIRVQGLDGDLKGADWRWQIVPQGQRTVVAYHGWANIPLAGYILKASMKREPYLEHGFMAGSSMVMMRAVRRTVEKR